MELDTGTTAKPSIWMRRLGGRRRTAKSMCIKNTDWK